MIIAAVLVATLGKTEIKTTQADGSTSTRTDSNMWIIGMIIGASGLILIIAVSATRSCEKKQSIYREAVAGMQGSEWKPIKANLANKNWEGFKENAGKLEGSDLNQLASAVAAIKRSRNAKKAWQ